MTDQADAIRRALDLERRAVDVPLTQIPAYRDWSRQKLRAGESEALIAHLDATSFWATPEEIAQLTDVEFEAMLEDLKESLQKYAAGNSTEF